MFTSASHEFRTPLNSIINSFDILTNSFFVIEEMMNPLFENLSDPEKRAIDRNAKMLKKFAKIGRNSSLMLLTLIEDILNLSKMEAGTFSVLKADFPIWELIEEIKDMFEVQ